MGLPALEKRMRVLELALSREARGMQCSCRPGQETGYHNAAELEKIIKVRCPVHSVRDSGYLRWTPSGMPLRPEDRHLCTCSPCAVRDFVQGTRGPLTVEEQEVEKRRWEREFAIVSNEEFRHEHAFGEVSLPRSQQNKRSW